MYIKKAQIKNIRSIVDFEIKFDNPAGWHVLIGDNGAGKSTIIRSIALVLVGDIQSQGLRADWNTWISQSASEARAKLDLLTDSSLDRLFVGDRAYGEKDSFAISIATNFNRSTTSTSIEDQYILDEHESPLKSAEIEFWEGFFSVAYGPYRRFRGGNSEWNDIYKNVGYEDLAAHLSVFDESVALTEATRWLQELNYKSLEQDGASQHSLDSVRQLINSRNFLPHNSKLENVSSDGVFFTDGNGATISVNQMSDGYRSVLSMTFELIRQLVRVYGSEKVFANIERGEMNIDLPGVVLVDEIDAHLHPTWQTRIGQWFTEYFPKLQFLVTTHSPLVCRAAENGSIWRLAAPGTDSASGEIIGLDRKRLIYGNVLDAFGTEVFGTNVTISEESVKKQEDLVKLSKKRMLDDISPEEDQKLTELKKVFTTDASIEL